MHARSATRLHTIRLRAASTAAARRRRTTGMRVAALLAAAVVAGACAPSSIAASGSPSVGAGDQPRPIVVVHRSATCSCCGEYEEVLRDHGFPVEQRIVEDVAAVKEELGIPGSEASCHTNEVGGYVAEGHVPMEALDELLELRPDADGVTLAGMPAGAPGMPGPQTEPLVVQLIADGEVIGELGRY